MIAAARLTIVLAAAPAIASALLLAAPVAVPVAVADDPRPYDAGRVLLTFTDPAIAESSGLTASGARDDVVFTLNDSGDRARLFAVDRSGRTLSTHTLPDVKARDWEDLARGPDRTLWIADIGDNGASRDRGVLVHRVPEPTELTGTTRTAPPATFRLRYEDGPRDAEALLVHPRTGQVAVVTKSLGGAGGLYLAPLPLTGDVNVLRRVADVPVMLVTGGALSPQGDRLVLRNYDDAYEWIVRGDSADDLVAALAGPATSISLPDTDQGEAISYSRDGRDLLTSSEGAGAPVHLLAGRAGAGSAAAERSASPGADEPGGADRRPGLLLALAAGLGGAALLLGYRRRRRG